MIQVVAGIIVLDDKILICQRKQSDNFHPLKWEFPGGKVGKQESKDDALIRELQEELSIQVLEFVLLDSYDFSYENQENIHLNFYRIDDYLSTVKNNQFEMMKWVKTSELEQFDFLEGDLDIVHKLKNNVLDLGLGCSGCRLIS